MVVGRSGKRVFAIVAVMAVGVVMLAGCSKDEAPAGTANPAPSPTLDAVQQDAVSKVLTVYNGYMEAWILALAGGDTTNHGLRKYVGDPLRLQLDVNLRNLSQDGVVYRGRPTWKPRVTSINMSTKPYTATVVDCRDSTSWDPVDKATGKSVSAPGAAKRYVVNANAEFFPEGWLITESKDDRSRTC